MPTPAPSPPASQPTTIGLAQAILDALEDPTAVLDRTGTIVAVNAAWRGVADDQGGDLESSGVGVDYLEVCRASAAAGCQDAARVRERLEHVLAGISPSDRIEYRMTMVPPTWWELRITPLQWGDGGAVLTHTDITTRLQLELMLRQQATSDHLTGLRNRVGLQEHLEQAFQRARRSGNPVTAMFIDLDAFKPVNDTWGHDVGDEVLRACADRIAQSVREVDLVARIGGDEFVVVCEDLEPDGTTQLAERITRAIAVPIDVPPMVQVTASIGVGSALPGDDPSDDIVNLLALADAAMYESKRAKDT
jgi:diguanylate cyclase (GGDEF)-like protein